MTVLVPVSEIVDGFSMVSPFIFGQKILTLPSLLE